MRKGKFYCKWGKGESVILTPGLIFLSYISENPHVRFLLTSLESSQESSDPGSGRAESDTKSDSVPRLWAQSKTDCMYSRVIDGQI